MDPAKAKFEFDAGRRLLRITAAGFWDLSDVEQFRLAQIEQIRSIASSGTRPKKLRLMIDIRQKTAQLAEVVNALQVLFGSLSTEVARTAVIVGGALVARQRDAHRRERAPPSLL